MLKRFAFLIISIATLLVPSGYQSPLSASLLPHGGALFLNVSGPTQVMIPLDQWGLTHMPDSPTSYLRENDQVHVWFAARRETYYLRGPSFDALTPHQLDADGNAVPVLAGDDTGFDADYAGGSAVFHATNGVDLIMFYHGEEYSDSTGCPQVTTASIGLARSTDGGETWSREGEIVSNQSPNSGCFRGAGSLDVIAAPDGYYYMYYMEWHEGVEDGVRLVRAPIASDGVPGAWLKYKDGAFTEPGLGGDSDLIIRRPNEDAVFMGIPSVSYNTDLERYIAVLVGRDGFYLSSSTDRIIWEVPRRVLAVPTLPDDTLAPGTTWNYYPTLLSHDQPSDTLTTVTGTLYYAQGTRIEGGGNSAHFMLRRPVQLSLTTYFPLAFHGANPDATPTPTPSQAVSLEPGELFAPLPGWTWVCEGDLAMELPGGQIVALHDEQADTGLVTRFDPDSQLLILAPWGGYCEALYAHGVAQAVQAAADHQLAAGCDKDGCAGVNMKRVGPTGTILEDDWQPLAPPGFQMPPGSRWAPPTFWTWVCSGDFTVTRPDGTTVMLHDDLPDTGLAIKLLPDSQVKVNAPWGGYCEPYYGATAEAGFQMHLTNLLDTGCGGAGCASVRAVTLNPAGEIVDDYWLP